MSLPTDDINSLGKLPAEGPALDYEKLYENGTLEKYNQEKLVCEVQLLSLGDFFPLRININLAEFDKEINNYQHWYSPYLERKDIKNNRFGICLSGLEGARPSDRASIPDAIKKAGRIVREADFKYPTEALEAFKSLHPITKLFPELGRSFIIKLDEGGYFPIHRDAKWIFRDTFRIVVFLKNSSSGTFSWELDGKKIQIEEGRTYYMNTRLLHHTFSTFSNSTHLILNIPLNLSNVLKVLSYSEG
jgi:hypothetical protein